MPRVAKLTLVLGGARSGKSRYAEDLIAALPAPWAYVATAQAGDAEMAKRIAAHRRRRGPQWRTLEAPRDLAAALQSCRALPVLLDCLTLWVSNLMARDCDDSTILAEADRLVAALTRVSFGVALVTGEVGAGIVPANPLARRFREKPGNVLSPSHCENVSGYCGATIQCPSARR